MQTSLYFITDNLTDHSMHARAGLLGVYNETTYNVYIYNHLNLSFVWLCSGGAVGHSFGLRGYV